MPDLLPSVAELVPHAGALSLLHRIVAVEGERLVAEVVVPADGLFTDSQGPGEGVGAWVGLEYIAQAVAAWAGHQGRAAGQAPRMGFLLGTRRFRCSVARFTPGQRLEVEVVRIYQADNGLGQFEGRVLAGGVEVAAAQVTVFGPDDPQKFLEGGETP